MTNIPLLFSILFFFACVASSLLGVYILYIDPKAITNRFFFAITISLSIWALGFSIAISAPDLETCLLWRRISAIGWGSLYSELLCFLIILTERRNILKKWWVCPLLFLPAIVTIYVFAISTGCAQVQYKLVDSPLGWMNIPINNVWDWVFYTYYIGYMMSGLGLLLFWKIKTPDLKNKKQANISMYSFIVALFIGTGTDILGNSYLPFRIPQMAPIFILIPIIAIYYSINHIAVH